jgi:dTDP-4-dehydrorhamnose reductase
VETGVRVLVTGGHGLLGTELQRCFAASGDEVHAPGRTELDITDSATVMEAVDGLRPDVIVNCAAWTAVDACEAEPQRALLVNGSAAGFVASAACASRAHMIHLSTDYVFSGELDRPYLESDEPGPRSVYGESKLAGERAVLAALPTATVVRTSWLCGEFGPNMAATILRLARNGQPLRFVSDQRGHPTFAADLAPMIRRLASERVAGVVHVTNQGSVSWFEFAQSVLRAARLDPSQVTPIRTEELDPPRPATRPKNSVLDNAVLRALGIPPLRRYEDALVELMGRLTG